MQTSIAMPDVCAKCGKPFTSGSILSALDKKWHPNCFNCVNCGSSLASQPFHVKDDVPYCPPCWTEKFQPKCSKCGKPIAPDEQYMTYKEKAYHKECFICHRCQGCLAGKQFCIKEGNFYCPECV
ncbi:unnamed protein product [Schistocephalus solidus]|uniref:LIM zinc-binding domain-containing protein n=1 Tax=Schistocephalus solidus TaxID=70667 RepID=A0A3P7EIA2_SCHSO|nr:unnamed protein product [Schistocephalus solidus]